VIAELNLSRYISIRVEVAGLDFEMLRTVIGNTELPFGDFLTSGNGG
jgi:hypothetical protein